MLTIFIKNKTIITPIEKLFDKLDCLIDAKIDYLSYLKCIYCFL